MKILHICLAAFYVDDYSYQENILPRMHCESGHKVKILASTETYIDRIHLDYVEPSDYMNTDGIPVSRVPYVSWIPTGLVRKLRVYKGVYDIIEEFKPDIIFLHDVQFLSVNKVIRYVKKHPEVKVFADCHTDYINSARSFLSKYFLHKIIYKYCALRIEPYVEKFFGTLPARCTFLHDVYGIPKSKIAFAPMGADDNYVEKYSDEISISDTKEKLGIKKHDVVIVTGGKYDKGKREVLNLMRAVNEIEDAVKLVVFGSVSDELRDKFDEQCSQKVIYAGWASVEESYKYFAIADCVFFPGTHSVFWEQAAGQGKPLIIRKWDGISHLDKEGNSIYIANADVESIKSKIAYILLNENLSAMKRQAGQVACNFRYRYIAQKVIEIE